MFWFESRVPAIFILREPSGNLMTAGKVPANAQVAELVDARGAGFVPLFFTGSNPVLSTNSYRTCFSGI